MALFLQNTTYDWAYHAEPSDVAAIALKNRQVYWPRGKMLGGTSAMNAMLYIHGDQRDFDVHWQKEVGSTWNWKSVSPYYKKSKSNQPSNGLDSLLKIEDFAESDYDVNIRKTLQNMFTELGLNKVADLNGKTRMGFGRAPGTLENGERSSSAKAYLHSSIVGNRTNLHIIKMAHVTRILFDERTKKATGVEFIRTPESKKLLATFRKELILSAGSVNTPQILMLSGIGPKAHLGEQEIPVICDVPGVGQNLQDHVVIPFVIKINRSTAKPLSLSTIADHFKRYLIERGGLFSNLGSTDLNGFIHTNNVNSDFPNVQLLNFFVGKQSEATIRTLLGRFNFPSNIINELVIENLEADTILLLVTLLNPKSQGQILLNSRDPFDAPKIFPNYLTNKEDCDVLAEAMEIFYGLTKTPTFQRHDGELVRFKLVECDQLAYASNEYWKCYMRYFTLTLYHPVGTAKMAQPSDSAGVVDSEFNVRCVEGLRVADASMLVCHFYLISYNISFSSLPPE